MYVQKNVEREAATTFTLYLSKHESNKTAEQMSVKGENMQFILKSNKK